MQCQKKKRDGNPCRAHALSGKQHCALHAEPSKAAELGRRGGRRRAVYSPYDLKEFEAPKTAAELRDLLAQSIIEIRNGQLDPKLANSISYLGAGFVRASEVADLEQEKQRRAIERREKLAREISPYDIVTGLVEIARTSTNDRTRVTAYWMLAELFYLRLKGLGDVSQLFDGWTAEELLDYADKGETPARLYPPTNRKLVNST
jgi:hypothetical protein